MKRDANLAKQLAERERAHCDQLEPYSRWIETSCSFGVSKERAKRNIALLGDSRSIDWRPAFKANAQKQRWRIIAAAKLGCAFNKNITIPPIITKPDCVEWRKDIPGWLRSHPEVDTVVMANGVYKARDAEGYRRQVAGYKQALASIPSSVRHVVVIREIPRSAPARSGGFIGLNVVSSSDADICIDQALKNGEAPGEKCSNPRSKVFEDFQDPAVEALPSLTSRGSIIDLTDFFCSSSRCFPVIGGVVVYEDSNHLTTTYSQTLAPYLMRAWRQSRAARR